MKLEKKDILDSFGRKKKDAVVCLIVEQNDHTLRARVGKKIKVGDRKGVITDVELGNRTRMAITVMFKDAANELPETTLDTDMGVA